MEFPSRNILNLLPAKLLHQGPYFCFTLVYLCILPFFLHQTDVDTIGYIAAAEHYAAGNFTAGINGYWSPLLSWLLVPFILCKIPALLSIKLINLAAGLTGLWLIRAICKSIQVKPLHSTICMLVAMPHLMLFSFCASTPDVLACGSWLAVFYRIVIAYERPGMRSAVWLAVAGAVAYVAKYYHFYAFGLLAGVLIGVTLLQRRKELAMMFSLALGLFLFISSLWMGAIMIKHGIFTPTTAAAHNLYTSQHPGATNHPQAGEHILPLQYERYLYTAWEYVPDYLTVTITDNTLKAPTSPVTIISKNITKILRYYYAEIILLLLSLIILSRSHAFRTSPLLLPMLVTTTVYPAGYFVTAIDYRYLLFCVIAICILACAALLHVKRPFEKYLLLLLLSVSFLLPFHRMIQFRHKGMAYFEMNAYFNAGDRLKGKRILSSPQAWSRAIGMCYQSNARYYDTLKPEKITYPNPELSAYDINFYLCLTSELTDELKRIGTIYYSGNFALVQLTSP
jgi:MFS family permease